MSEQDDTKRLFVVWQGHVALIEGSNLLVSEVGRPLILIRRHRHFPRAAAEHRAGDTRAEGAEEAVGGVERDAGLLVLALLVDEVA